VKRFISAINLKSINQTESIIEKLTERIIPGIVDNSGAYVDNKDIKFFLPDKFLRKLVFAICKKDINKIQIENQLTFLSMLEEEFIIRNGIFPYSITEFLLSFDDVDLQKIMISLISKGLAVATTFVPVFKSDQSNRITQNLPVSVANDVKKLAFSCQFDLNWDLIAFYQLGTNLSLISKEIGHKGLNDYVAVKQRIFDEEILDFLRRTGIDYLFDLWRKKNLLYRLFSEVLNSDLAVLIRSEFSEFFIKNCSKRRIEMLMDEENYKETIKSIKKDRILASFIKKGIFLEIIPNISEDTVFRKNVIGIKGNEDYNIILSRMKPIEFAVAFYSLSPKVKNFIASKVSDTASVFLKDFFDNKIFPVAHINKGWIKSARKVFNDTAYFLSRIGKIYIVDNDGTDKKANTAN